MTLRQKQTKFAGMVILLLIYLWTHGYVFTIGDVFADRNTDTKHSKFSFHYLKLAIDINLFHKITHRYLTSTKAHAKIGAFWVSIGGTWGGNFAKPDGNHYSLGEGKR